MQFDSWQAFVAMGGHGLYVWLAYGVAVLSLVAGAMVQIRRRKSVLRNIRQHYNNESEV